MQTKATQGTMGGRSLAEPAPRLFLKRVRGQRQLLPQLRAVRSAQWGSSFAPFLDGDASGTLGANVEVDETSFGGLKRWLPVTLSVAALVMAGCAAGLPPHPPGHVAPVPLRATDEFPAWLARLIQKMESAPVANPPRTVWAYRYEGDSVYLVSSDCCDMMELLYDKSGRVLCAPSGGISGRGDGKCPDFEKQGKRERVVWKDRRRPGHR